MTSNFRVVQPAMRSLLFPKHSIPLHAIITCGGYARKTDPRYSWDGLKRGQKEFAIFQYTLSGQGCLRYEAQTHRILPHMALLLTVLHNHRYWLPKESSGWEFIYLCLTGREVLRVWKQIIAQKGPVINLSQSSPVLKHATATVRDVLAGRVTSPFQASARAYALTMALLDEHTLRRPTGVQKPRWLAKVTEHCRQHLHQFISMDTLAHIAGCSRYHFGRVFKTWMGISPVQYILDQRLCSGANQLKESTLSVKEIATRCGFNDTNYFCRAFRKGFGISPGQFRHSEMY